MKKQKVAIPPLHFLSEAKNEYFDYKARIIAEIVQNSVDAGSSRIDLIFENDKMTFIDNGKGMSKKTMVDALLTLGGSEKENGNAGGFGAAKKILLFSHESYEIHSLNTHVLGSVLEYSFIEDEKFNGTKIIIKPFPEFDYDSNQMIDKAKTFLTGCNLNCDVYINDEKFANYTVLPKVRETEEMIVFAQNAGKYDNEVTVTKNGIKMFSRHVTNLHQKVMVEIKKDSKTSFTQNRDSLKGKAYAEFNALIDELNIDKFSFSKKGVKKRLFIGAKSFFSFVKKIISSKESVLKPNEKQQLEQVMMKVVEDKIDFYAEDEVAFQEIKKYNVVEDNVLEKVKEDYHKEQKADINYNFLVDICDSTYDEVPEEYMPETMGFENTQIALLWRHCILGIVEACDFQLNFTIGFTLSKYREAVCYQENGIDFILINPEVLKEKYQTLDARFYKTLLVACHELCHVCKGKRYHDESFSTMFEEIATKALITIDKNKIWSKVEEDKL